MSASIKCNTIYCLKWLIVNKMSLNKKRKNLQCVCAYVIPPVLTLSGATLCWCASTFFNTTSTASINRTTSRHNVARSEVTTVESSCSGG